VELVEQDGAHTVEGGVVLHHAREHPFGHDLDPGLLAHLRVHADPVAHRLPGLLAPLLRHEPGGGPGRQPPRLQHDEFLIPKPRLAQQRRGHASRLAGASGGLQHSLRLLAQGFFQIRQYVLNRQVRHSEVRRCSGKSRWTL